MKFESLKNKITIMFIIPILVILYMSSLFIEQKSEHKSMQKYKSDINKLLTKETSLLNALLNNIQIERGLSSGYILSKTKNIKQKLLQQHLLTDMAYKNLLRYNEVNSKTKKQFLKLLSSEIIITSAEKFDDLKNINTIRKKVLNSKISFDEALNYYTSINKKIIKIIKMFNITIYIDRKNNTNITALQYIKEYAGLQRAYVYSYLLSDKKQSNFIFKIESYQDKQEFFYKKFIELSSKPIIKIFKNYVEDEKIILDKLRAEFKNGNLSKDDAELSFRVFSSYIQKIDLVLVEIFKIYIDEANKTYLESENDLYIVIFLAILSLLVLMFILAIINKLIKEEEYLVKNLRFASYAFDSHEAIVITDTEANAVKINKAFTDITGYTSDEIIGKNVKILKSNVHSDMFFKDIWQQITTVGKWNGEIYNKRKNGDIYPELLSITAIKDEKGNTTNFIAHFIDISELKEAQEKIQHQADYDYLTGLMNRKRFTERLEEEFTRAKRHSYYEAFLFIDIDNFKYINDNYGHLVGDVILKEFAIRLKKEFRNEDIVARISGDEFAVVLTNSNQNKDELLKTVDIICKKILKNINKDIVYDNDIFNISISIGVTIFPLEQKNPLEVINQADAAMYKAKKDGKNRYRFYK